MRFSTLLLITGLCMSMSALAQVYRWTDENGQVHFSSRPPEQGQSEQVKIRNQPKISGEDENAPAETPANTPSSAPVITQENTLTPQQRAEYCRTARANKARLSENFNRRIVAGDGSVRRLDDAERARLMQKVEENIRDYCS